MEQLHHELWIVTTVNALLGPIVAAMLAPFGYEFAPGHDVIPDYLVMCGVVAVVLALLALLVRSRLSVDNPGRLQVVMEEIVGAFVDMLKTNIGEKGPRYFPLVAAIGLFIFTANMLGKVPGFMSPTANINVTLGCALTVWVYYHIQGIRTQGIVTYVKHFAAPPGAPLFIAPIMLPIEVISHLSRVLSLSIRLFGNIFGEELVVLILASIVPFLVPLPMMALGVVTGTLQAFIFVMLTMIYLSGAVHTEHEDEVREHGESHTHAVA
jgi:F-type H+-transporting ATPase subunit a